MGKREKTLRLPTAAPTIGKSETAWMKGEELLRGGFVMR
jgi:hypothetical protein